MRQRHSLIEIRKATPDDSASILECLRAAFEDYRASYTPMAFADTVLTPEALQNRLARMSVFVAVSESGQVVGTIGCHVVDATGDHATDCATHEGHLRGMAVLPAWQGSGVAAQLLEAAESELRGRGCTQVTLGTTEPLLQAMRFYEKHGFRRSGRVTDFFGMRLIECVKRL